MALSRRINEKILNPRLMRLILRASIWASLFLSYNLKVSSDQLSYNGVVWQASGLPLLFRYGLGRSTAAVLSAARQPGLL